MLAGRWKQIEELYQAALAQPPSASHTWQIPDFRDV